MVLFEDDEEENTKVEVKKSKPVEEDLDEVEEQEAEEEEWDLEKETGVRVEQPKPQKTVPPTKPAAAKQKEAEPQMMYVPRVVSVEEAINILLDTNQTIATALTAMQAELKELSAKLDKRK